MPVQKDVLLLPFKAQIIVVVVQSHGQRASRT